MRLKSIKGSMRNHIAGKYQYHEQERQTCHEATRATVLNVLDTWIRDKSSSLKQCRWMTSMPAAGKTAIAMTTAQCFLLDRRTLSAKGNERRYLGDDAPILYGQYFCSHKNNSSNIHNLFPYSRSPTCGEVTLLQRI